MPAEIDKRLPPGKTCQDCTHFERCLMLFGCNPFSVSCCQSTNEFNDPYDSTEWQAMLIDHGGEG